MSGNDTKVERYSATVRLEGDDKTDFFDFITKATPAFSEKGKTIKPTVILRELVKSQLQTIKANGGTLMMGEFKVSLNDS